MKRKLKTSYTNQHGFTIMEVMFTVAILAIGIAGLGVLSTTNSKFNRTANESTVATIFAEQKLERLIAQGYSDWSVWDTGASGTDTPIGNSANRAYDWNYTVDPIDAETIKVTFTVSWDAVGAGNREFVFRTIITKKPSL